MFGDSFSLGTATAFLIPILCLILFLDRKKLGWATFIKVGLVVIGAFAYSWIKLR